MVFNPYTTLRVDTNCTLEAIKKAYRTLCLRYHPDKAGQSTEANETFIKIQSAYEILSNPKSRRSYDRKLRTSTNHKRRQRRSGGSRRTRHPANPNVNRSGENPILRSRIGASEVIEEMSLDISNIQKRFSALITRFTPAYLERFHLNNECAQSKKTAVTELKQRMRTVPLGSWKDTPEVRQFVSSIYELREHIDRLNATISWVEIISPTMKSIESQMEFGIC
ncbi:hypothetical protein F5X96DRAFT_665000 [Biscogniauxia mediterranea]|nr:hypothetical protein F5X96DRAFT_665000 [Biscogniauxia mediterranea]